MEAQLTPSQLGYLVAVGHELAASARRLGMGYLGAHHEAGGEIYAFTVEGRRVLVDARGFEIDLTARPEWRQWPPEAGL